MRRLLLLLSTLAVCLACSRASPAAPARPQPQAPAPTTHAAQPDTAPYARVLRAYLRRDGRFDYAGLHGDASRMAELDAYLASAATAQPDAWPRDEQLAFYLNVYNALVLRSVERRWPIDSVMHEDGFFDTEAFTVAGQRRTLNALETDVIRGSRFAEPRIHFALNCASVGCPRLWATPLTGQNLEAELERRTRLFVRATTVIDRAQGTATVSKLFSWFATDFGPAGGLNAFIAARLEPEDAAVLHDPGLIPEFADYDWALNSAAPSGR